MTDDVIDRCTAAGVRCLHKELPGDLTVGEARPLITEAILSALKPGDVLPNGCVVAKADGPPPLLDRAPAGAPIPGLKVVHRDICRTPNGKVAHVVVVRQEAAKEEG